MSWLKTAQSNNILSAKFIVPTKKLGPVTVMLDCNFWNGVPYSGERSRTGGGSLIEYRCRSAKITGVFEGDTYGTL